MIKILFPLLLLFGSIPLRAQTLNIYHKTNAYELTPTHKRVIDSILATLEPDTRYFRYTLAGHTDSIASLEYNTVLSRNRCLSVANYLKSKGIREDQIMIKWFAFKEPAATNTSEGGRYKNRRTSIDIEFIKNTPEWVLKEQLYKVPANKTANLTTERGCVLKIRKGSLLSPDVKVDDTIDVRIIEYNSPADFIASGIPMSFTKDGVLHMYSSSQMFSVKAYHKGKEIQLNPSKPIELKCDFVDTTAGVGFYKFSAGEHLWRPVETVNNHRVEIEEDPVAESNGGANTNIPETDATTAENDPANPYTSAVNNDDFTRDEIEVDTGKTKSGMGGSKYGPYGKFYHRWKVTRPFSCLDICADIPLYLAQGKYYTQHPITGLQVVLKKRFMRAQYKVKLHPDCATLSPELAELTWISHYTKAERKIIKKIGIGRPFEFNLGLDTLMTKKKYENHLIFSAPLSYTDQVKYNLVNGEIIDKSTFPKRFMLKLKDEQSIPEETLEKLIKLRLDSIEVQYCFWKRSRKVMSEPERRMTFPEWRSFFNSNYPMMAGRYQQLLATPLDTLKKRWGCCLCDTCCDMPPDSKFWNSEVKSGAPILLLGMGIYNFDILIERYDTIPLGNPVFITPKGRTVKPNKIYITVPGINGLFTPDAVSGLCVFKHTETTLLLMDEYNHRYLIRIQAGNSYTNKTIVVEDVTAQTETLDDLRKVLKVQ